MEFVVMQALERSKQFGIEGVTLQLTQGVVKNIIPTIASTNALIAGACALETLKIVTLCSLGLNNYMMYVGTDSVYTLKSEYEKDPGCPMCSFGVLLPLSRNYTLQETINALLEHKDLKNLISMPSINYGTKNLYVRGALEESTRPNLDKTMDELLGSPRGIVVVTVNDKKLAAPLRVRLQLIDTLPDQTDQ